MAQDEKGRTLKAKLCLAGEPAVGKSSLIKRFVLDEYDDRYIATLGTKVTKKVITLENKEYGLLHVDLIIWDVMGTRSIRDLLKEAYYHGAHGVMAVCDLTRKETLFELDSWSRAIQSVTGTVPILVVANKNDLVDSREISDDELQKYCDSRAWRFVTTSAKTGENVEAAFAALGESAIGSILDGRPRQQTLVP